jgi:hypothetical protein
MIFSLIFEISGSGRVENTFLQHQHPCSAIHIGHPALSHAPLGCINSSSPQSHHCIKDIMILSVIFAIFCSETQSQSQSQSQSQIPFMIAMSSIGRRAAPWRPLGRINSPSHRLYHCINDIMIFSLIFAVFGPVRGQNTIVEGHPCAVSTRT